MKRLLSITMAAAALTMASTGAAHAQSVIVLGVGPTIPIGDFADYAKLGFLAHGGVDVAVAPNVSVGAHGFYGMNSHDFDGDKTNLYGGVGTIGYGFPTSGSVMPQVFAGGGYLVHSYKSESFPSAEGSEGSLAAIVGTGLGFPLGGINAAVNAWILMGFGENDETRIVGIDAGVAIPLGG